MHWKTLMLSQLLQCVCICMHIYIYIYIYIYIRRCPWCKGYRHRKWTRRHEFKSWTRLIAFHIALIPFGKVWIQLISFQLWVNSRADCVLQAWWDNPSRRRKTELKPVKLRLKIWPCVMSCPSGGVGVYIYIYSLAAVFHLSMFD